MVSNVELIDLRNLRSFAAGLACMLRPGDVLALSGPIGAGKTTLTREIVRRLTGVDAASSPSFTLWQRYEGHIPVNHLDLYRIEDPRELPELGLEEAFDARSCTIVEWPGNAPGLLPIRHLAITIEGVGDEPRRLCMTPS